MTTLQWNAKQHRWIACDSVSSADRAVHYGDGLFETLRFNAQGEIPLWRYHFARLSQGLDALHFPIASQELIVQAMKALPMTERQSAGKLIVSRGVATRGYAIPQHPTILLLWQSFSAPSWAIERFPQGFKTEFSTLRLARQPALQGIKHLNRLEQVLARHALPMDCQELILCDTSGFVIEGCMSNVFMLKKGQLYTPALRQSGVNGVIRRWLMENYPVQEYAMQPEDLLQAQALFFCNSLNGIIPVRQLAQRHYRSDYSGWQQIVQLQKALESIFC